MPSGTSAAMCPSPRCSKQARGVEQPGRRLLGYGEGPGTTSAGSEAPSGAARPAKQVSQEPVDPRATVASVGRVRGVREAPLRIRVRGAGFVRVGRRSRRRAIGQDHGNTRR